MTTTAATSEARHLIDRAAQPEVGPLEQIDLLRRAIGCLEDEIAGAVAVARAEEYSWTQIGATLGLTKQGAQQRYTVGRPAHTDDCQDPRYRDAAGMHLCRPPKR